MNNVVGYCFIRPNATTCKGAKNPELFFNKMLRVMEFDPFGGVLVINNQSTELGMFDKEDISSSFKCEVFNEVILPPNLSFEEKAIYYSKTISRKGGYNDILKNMVIANSLRSNKFNDNFLWQKQ